MSVSASSTLFSHQHVHVRLRQTRGAHLVWEAGAGSFDWHECTGSLAWCTLHRIYNSDG